MKPIIKALNKLVNVWHCVQALSLIRIVKVGDN